MMPSASSLSLTSSLTGSLTGGAAAETAAEQADATTGPPDLVRSVQDDSEGALQRLSRLPAALQDGVIRQLPLGDLVVWQQIRHHFRDGITSSLLQEWALRLSQAPAFPRAPFTQGNYGHFLKSWLDRLSGHCLDPDWPGTRFRPDVLFCALIRALKDTPHLGLDVYSRFFFDDVFVQNIFFSPDGCQLVIKGLEKGPGPDSWRYHILEREGTGWRRGCPFVDSRGVSHLCFAAHAHRVAVITLAHDIVVWGRPDDQAASWQLQLLLRDSGHGGPGKAIPRVKEITLSASGRLVAILRTNGDLTIWNQNTKGRWTSCGLFPTCEQLPRKSQLVFSPDEHWLLLHSRQPDYFAIFGRGQERFWKLHDPVGIADACIKQAFFHPCHRPQELFVLQTNGLLVRFRSHQNQWFALRSLLQYPGGINAIRFSPDGQNLLAHCDDTRVLLWTQDARGLWMPCHTLSQSPGEPQKALDHVSFDPFGHWLVVWKNPAPDGSTHQMWVKDSLGVWQCRPDSQDGPLMHYQCFLAGSDGQHAAVLATDARTSQMSIALLERHGDRWTTRARCPTFCSGLAGIAMDPFCFTMAAMRFHVSTPMTRCSLELLQVREESAPAPQALSSP